MRDIIAKIVYDRLNNSGNIACSISMRESESLTDEILKAVSSDKSGYYVICGDEPCPYLVSRLPFEATWTDDIDGAAKFADKETAFDAKREGESVWFIGENYSKNVSND